MSKKISELTTATDVTVNDFFQVVDLEDSTMAASGTNKKISARTLGNNLPVTATGSSASRSLKDRFADTVNVKDFGAVGDGVTDDTSAIQAALTKAFNSGSNRNTVYFPSGTYRTTSTLNMLGTAVSIYGTGAFNDCVIYADFTGGPCLHVKGRNSRIENLAINGNEEVRTSISLDHGILISPNDSSGVSCWFTKVSNVDIRNQGSCGILAIGGTWLSTFEHLQIYNNGGHGMRFDNGMIDSRTNKANPGEVQIRNVMIYDNIGHGIMIGNDDSISNRGFRFHIDNADLYRNALVAGVRKIPTQMWAFIDSSKIVCSAFAGANTVIDYTPVTSGAVIAGSSTTIENNRALYYTPYAFRVLDLTSYFNYVTQGLLFDGIRSFSTAVDATVVQIDDNTRDIQCSPRDSNNSASPAVSIFHNKPLIKRCEVVRVTEYQTYNNMSTPVDVVGLSTYINIKEIVQFKVNILYRGPQTADLKIRFVIPTDATIWFSPSNSVLTDSVNTVVESSASFTTETSIIVGTAPDNTVKLLTIEGEVRTLGTAGNLQVQACQNIAIVGDTQIVPASSLQLIRH